MCPIFRLSKQCFALAPLDTPHCPCPPFHWAGASFHWAGSSYHCDGGSFPCDKNLFHCVFNPLNGRQPEAEKNLQK